jgi:tail protein
MLTLAEVRNVAGSLLSLELNDTTDGFVVKEIKGLDPVNAVLSLSDYAQQDGGQFHFARRQTRNIIFVLSLEPERATTPTTVKALRNQLYSYFMPKNQVDLRFIDSGGLTVTTSGRVETFETPLFASESTVSVSILCPDPDLIELTSETVTGDTVSDTTETLVTYDGTVETGIVFVLNVDRTEDAFTIYHRKPSGEIVSMDFAGSLVDTDVLTINTITGTKGAVLTHSSVDSSVLYGISAQSSWIELQPGDNYIRVYATGAAIPWEITYTNRYGGL